MYSEEDPLHEIENELYRMTDRFSSILIFGDYNSRTRTFKDFIEVDEYLSTRFHSDELLCEYDTDLSYFQKSHVSLHRINSDTGINNYGYRLLDFCKTNSLFILNGRVGEDGSMGRRTCKNSSTIDYFICSANLMPNIVDLQVHEFSNILSDAHCPISLNIQFKTQINPSQPPILT